MGSMKKSAKTKGTKGFPVFNQRGKIIQMTLEEFFRPAMEALNELNKGSGVRSAVERYSKRKAGGK